MDDDDTSTTTSSDGSSEASPSSNDVEDNYNTASSNEASSQPGPIDTGYHDWLEQLEEEFEGYSTPEILHQLKALERDRHRCAITGQVSDYSFSNGVITGLNDSEIIALGVSPTSAVHIIPPLTNENHEVSLTFNSMTVVLNQSHCIA